MDFKRKHCQAEYLSKKMEEINMVTTKNATRNTKKTNTISKVIRNEKRELSAKDHAEIIDAQRAVKRASREYSPFRKNNYLEDTKYRRDIKSGNTNVSVRVKARPRVHVSVVEDGRKRAGGRSALKRMAKTGEYKPNTRNRGGK